MSRLTINSNIASLNAQRNFGIATNKLTESYTRLSSGLRINKSVDDAAGLSISESLKADTRIFNQGVRNLNDGVSLLNIADGALGELSSIAVRLNELAEQSANGTLGNKQRLALDQEAQSLAKEYNRIARTTAFNGQNIFDGDFGELSLAAGGGRESLISDGLGGAIGDGSFLANQTFSAGIVPASIEMGDFNGDGISDFVTADNGGSMSIFLGNGDGSFSARQSFVTESNPNSVVVGDFNGDGITDVVISNAGSNNISVFLGNGEGSFSSQKIFMTGITPYNVSVADFNGDGISDLVTTDYNSGSLSILIGNGDGSFTARQSIVNGSNNYAVTVGDFNGDGITDLVSTATGNSLSLFLGKGDGSFSASISFVTGTNANSVVVADFNGDGISDLVTTDSGDNSVSVLLGNGNGGFLARQSFAVGITPYGLKTGDFNGDGIIDLASADYNSVSVSILLGNGNGSFSARQSFVTAGNSYSVIIGDFNEDGVADLITANGGSNSVSVFLGNSNDGVSALQSFSLKTQHDARESMSYLRKTLERIGVQRGHIGAFQSRVDFAINNLKQSSLAYNEANSRITDADVAEESSSLVANQILQKAAASILAQANQQPTLVLGLLKNI